MIKEFIIVTSVPLDEPVILNRLVSLIDQCSTRGYSLSLLAAHYVDVEIPSKLRRNDLKLELYRSSRRSKERNLFFRLIRELYISFKLSRLLLTLDRKTAFVFVTIPSMFLPSFLRQNPPGFKFCLDIRDLTWEYLIGASLAGSALGITVREMLKFIIKKYECISVSNENERHYVNNKFSCDHNRVVVVSNGVSKAQYAVLSKLEIASSNKTNRITISYIGNVGIAQTFKTLLDVAEFSSNLTVNIVGSGARLQDVQSEISHRGIKNVSTPGRVIWEDVIEFYKGSDILFLSLDVGYSSAIPSKLYEYLVVGKPIIFVGEIRAKKQFQKFEGLYFCSDAKRDLEHTIKQIGQLPPLSQAAVDNNRKLIQKHFIRENNWSNYLDHIENLDYMEKS